MKVILTKEPILKFYDPKRSIKISDDASQTGLGAVLLQDYDGTWQPVAYASRSMTDAECRYAQIEKELLSITFACERFHQFVAGKLMFVADTLSRAVDPTTPLSGKLIEDIQAYVNMIVEALPVADSKMKLINKETEQDQTLR